MAFHRIKITLTIVFLQCIGWIALFGQTHLEKALVNFIGDPVFNGASIGISVVDIQKNEMVLAHQPNLILIPASTQKLWTTAAALDILGPDYRFKTELYYKGEITENTLTGDIILKGYGDPTFCSKFISGDNMEIQFKKLINWIKSSGIKKINGNIIVDISFQSVPPEQPTWTWMDLGNYYAGGAWGLNIVDNEYQITFQQKNALGETPEIVKIEPEVPGLFLTNELTTAGAHTGDNAYIYGAPYQLRRIIRGTIPAGRGHFTIRGSLPDPPAFAAYHLFNSIIAAGIEISGIPTVHKQTGLVQKDNTVLLGIIHSPLLKEIVTVINQRSNNSYSESIIRYLGSSKFKGHHLYHGTDVMLDWLQSLGIDKTRLYIQDGSGLSRTNGCTAAQMALSLSYIHRKEYISDFKKSLAEPGAVGTLQGAFSMLPKGAQLKAKSGSLGRVRCYAGYLDTVNGHKLSFAILCNNFNGSSTAVRRKIEELISAIATY